MNRTDVKEIARTDSLTLLYSHDDSRTRHAVEIRGTRYVCRLNESPCFQRGTHQAMLRVAGFTGLTAVTAF